MGFYIDPSDMSKEAWLDRHGEPLQEKPNFSNCVSQMCLPVVLIDNGPFTAAGIAYCEAELNAFTRSDDFRPKKFYQCNVRDLNDVTGQIYDVLKELNPSAYELLKP